MSAASPASILARLASPVGLPSADNYISITPPASLFVRKEHTPIPHYFNAEYAMFHA